MLSCAVPKKDIQKNWTSLYRLIFRTGDASPRAFTQIAAIAQIDPTNLTGGEQVERIEVRR